MVPVVRLFSTRHRLSNDSFSASHSSFNTSKRREQGCSDAWRSVEEGAMNKQTILAGLLLLGVMSAASAHDRDHAGNDDGDRSYLGAGLAELSVDDEDFGYEESDNGFKIFGGYEFNEYFAAELTYIGGATVIDETLFPIEEVDLRALSATFIARAPL